MYISLPVPQPTVRLTNSSVMAGSDASPSCEVTLNQYSSYSSGMVAIGLQLINMTDFVVSTESTGLFGATRDNYLTVSNVDVSKAGLYQCRAVLNYTGTNDQYVEEPPATDSPSATLSLQSKSCILILLFVDPTNNKCSLQTKTAILSLPTFQPDALVVSSLCAPQPVQTTVAVNCMQLKRNTNSMCTVHKCTVYLYD